MNATATTRLLPPALPRRLVLLVLSLALACITLPRLVHAAPSRANGSAAIQSNIGHVDITRAASASKPATTTRLSLRTLDLGGYSELRTVIDGIEYELKLRVSQEKPGPVAELQLRARGEHAPTFELVTRSLATRNQSVLVAANAQLQVSLTLE